MAKKAKKKPAKKKSSSKKPRTNAWKTDADVKAIINECTTAVYAGLATGQSLAPAAQTALENKFGPSVYKKLHHRTKPGDWKKDGPKVTTVATHLGQICALLNTQTQVPVKVAKAAYAAIREDEVCKSATGLGGGDWCYG